MAPTAHTIEARDGLALNCWAAGPTDAEEAVLYVHGSITCARALFAPPVPDDESYSWLAATADAGRAAYALDIRGYGDSERPPELDEPPTANGPPVRADRAADDIGDALAAIRDDHDRIHLVGVSWGTCTCGRFVERDDPAVASLTQVAPVYEVPYDVEDGLRALGLDPAVVSTQAYYEQVYEVVRERQGDVGPLFEAIWRTQVESNQGESEDRYIAQTGALADYADCGEGNPPYDAAGVDVPTLVVRGTDDTTSVRADALSLYDDLALPDDESEYAELAGGDHYLMHGHRRGALYELVDAFQGRV